MRASVVEKQLTEYEKQDNPDLWKTSIVAKSTNYQSISDIVNSCVFSSGKGACKIGCCGWN